MTGDQGAGVTTSGFPVRSWRRSSEQRRRASGLKRVRSVSVHQAIKLTILVVRPPQRTVAPKSGIAADTP